MTALNKPVVRRSERADKAKSEKGEIMEREYALWINVVELLEKSGAVTLEDSRSPRGQSDTDGQKLYEAIRAWGESLAELSSLA